MASHGDRILRRLERNVFPWLGKRPIAEIIAPDLLSMLRRIESRSALETTIGRCRIAGRYFATPWRPVVLNATPQAILAAPSHTIKEKHYASIIEPKRIAGLLRAIDAYQGFFATKCALRLAPLVFVRPGELH